MLSTCSPMNGRGTIVRHSEWREGTWPHQTARQPASARCHRQPEEGPMPLRNPGSNRLRPANLSRALASAITRLANHRTPAQSFVFVEPIGGAPFYVQFRVDEAILRFEAVSKPVPAGRTQTQRGAACATARPRLAAAGRRIPQLAADGAGRPCIRLRGRRAGGATHVLGGLRSISRESTAAMHMGRRWATLAGTLRRLPAHDHRSRLEVGAAPGPDNPSGGPVRKRSPRR